MLKHLVSGVVILILVFGLSAHAQDSAKAAAPKEMGKSEMTKESGKMEGEMSKGEMGKSEMAKKEMGPLMVGACDPACGWMMKSHDQKEIAEAMRKHAQKVHNMKMTDKEAMAKIKPATGGEMK
jgi:predicted small metal-binding protein